MITNRQKDFIRELEQAAGRHYAVDVFSDAVAMMAAAIEKPFCLNGDEVEERYMSLAKKYSHDELDHITRMFGIVLQALTERRESFLGPILEEIGASNTHNGQFLTPQSVATLCSRICNGFDIANHQPGEIVTVNDPAVGAGVMLIAEGEELVWNMKIPQRDILLIGGDIDRRACDITFIELSLLGYAAEVHHEDALLMKRYSPTRYTPGYFLHAMPMRRLWRNRVRTGEERADTVPEPAKPAAVEEVSAKASPATARQHYQPELFEGI